MEDKNYLIYSSIASAISGFLLIAATGNLAYGYYEFLRIAVFASALLSMITALKINAHMITVLSFCAAIVFNPILKIYLEKSTWVIIDLIAALFFFSVAVFFYVELDKRK